MQRYQLIKKDARYYYFNNEAGEMVQSPIHCYDEGRISMPDHQRDEDGYLCGDLHPDAIPLALAYTPVPGGVGPMTVNTLMLHTVMAAFTKKDI